MASSFRNMPSQESIPSSRLDGYRHAGTTHLLRSPPQEVGDQLRAFVGQEAFRVILHALDGQRLMANPHQLVPVRPRGYFKVTYQRNSVNHQGMIPRRGKGIR